MTDLSLSVDKLRNVGTRNSSRLRRLGIKTLKDLLWHFPARYDDYTETVPISDTVLNQKVNIQGEIVKISTKRLFPRRMFITDAIVKDPSGAVRAVWFNQPFIENQLPEGTFVSLAGKIKTGKRGTYIASPTYERISPSLTSHISHLTSHLKHTKGLVPVYPETEGVTSKYLRFLIKPLLSTIKIVDPTPEEILKKYDFPALTDAVREIHFPSSEEKAKTAKERLAFDDLMLFQAKALLERRKMNQLKSTPISFDEKVIKEFIAQLPFDLTGDQKIALFEIHKDLEKNYPMNRLLEGDVGSGKTVVALSAAYRAARAEFQTVFMAPTEVVANQHFKTATSIITDKNISIGLLTASMSKFNNKDIPKKTLKEKIMSGDVNIVIGTHALIQKDVLFGSLSLVVLDEQHRFGINQRSALIKNKDTVPHLLSMTATPIPRTLALTIYGDLDISIIKEKPKNRQKIVTKIISPTQRKNTYQFIRDEVEAGRQVFVVCPRIELTTNDQQPTTKPNGYQSSVVSRQSHMKLLWQDVKAVEEEYKKLSEQIFPDLRVAMLHGKLNPKEKNQTMSGFKDKKYDILVSTSVIEVGVDIPNATIMAIESAERFGLAQLHQFRGRVGRGEQQSYCLLFSSSADKTTNQRLNALVSCDDGFELAEKDMALRGPGEFMGTKQSGMPDLAMASLANVDLIKKARLEARLLLKEDPSLSRHPLLQQRLSEFQKMTHFE